MANSSGSTGMRGAEGAAQVAGGEQRHEGRVEAAENGLGLTHCTRLTYLFSSVPLKINSASAH